MREISRSLSIKYKFCWNILALSWKEDLTNERIRLISRTAIHHQLKGGQSTRNLFLLDSEIYYWSDLTTRERSLALSRARSTGRLSDPRLTRMKFITLHLSQSRARTLLSNFPTIRQDAPHRRRRWRPDVPRRSSSPTRSRSRILGGHTKRVAREGRGGTERRLGERREETEIEKGRGRWRLQGYTRPEQSPVRSRERVRAVRPA